MSLRADLNVPIADGWVRMIPESAIAVVGHGEMTRLENLRFHRKSAGTSLGGREDILSIYKRVERALLLNGRTARRRDAMTGKLIMFRHGESDWNRANRFTGWTDVDLTAEGEAQARQGARRLAEAGIFPTRADTSMLLRSIRTLWLALGILDRAWIPVRKTWRLNERHYGALQGLHKAETIEREGEAQVQAWRRGYAVRPPALEPEDDRNPAVDARYATVPPDELPLSESLEDTLMRVMPYWRERAAPALFAGETLLVAGHGNSQRALVKHLEGMGDDEVEELEIPMATAWVYEFDERLRVGPRREFD